MSGKSLSVLLCGLANSKQEPDHGLPGKGDEELSLPVGYLDDDDAQLFRDVQLDLLVT